MRKSRLRSYSANRQQSQVGAHVPCWQRGAVLTAQSLSQSMAQLSRGLCLPSVSPSLHGLSEGAEGLWPGSCPEWTGQGPNGWLELGEQVEPWAAHGGLCSLAALDPEWRIATGRASRDPWPLPFSGLCTHPCPPLRQVGDRPCSASCHKDTKFTFMVSENFASRQGQEASVLGFVCVCV